MEKKEGATKMKLENPIQLIVGLMLVVLGIIALIFDWQVDRVAIGLWIGVGATTAVYSFETGVVE